MKRHPRNVEFRLISELLKNSHRSDRELAKVLGISQPTVSRIIKRLEEEGYIREYTIIPSFSKLGFHLLGLTFIRIRKELNAEEIENVRAATKERLAMSRFGIVMLERGIGLKYDGVIMCFYRNYSEYTEHHAEISKYPFVELSELAGFLINLDDPIRYRPLTLSILSDYLARAFDESKDQP
jgi:DNA-binding Lrp family transcriptional regulator